MNVGNKGGQNPTQPSKALTRRGGGGNAGPPIPTVPVIENTRCKVCNCPYRREIDMCLVSGWSQTQVMRHFNQVLGENYFNKMNISRHARYHLDARDAAVRRIIETRAKQFLGDVDAIEGTILTKGAVVDTLIQRGMEGLHVGAVEIKAQDILSAVQLLDKMESEWKETALDEVLNEWRTFAICVKEAVGDELFEQISVAFESKMAERDRPALMPLAADKDLNEIEGEAFEEDEDE